MTTGAPLSPTRGRSRARTLLPLGLAAWLVLEVWLLALVADAANVLVVPALLVGAGVLGAAVVRRAGRRAFTALTGTLRLRPEDGVPAGTGGAGNGMLMLGGLLLMLPGLVSDAVGLLLLVPPVRTAAARRAERALDRGVGAALRRARAPRPDGRVVPGEVVRDHPGPPSGPRDARPPLAP
ncbi:FxsA family protein [Streptomyces somaliensis]|uniref:FxsA family membrane protein n=1 Tax=Streptomyces somaliensis TaxID=78355 RepID=UPI0020CEBF69|nr:FxsA family membrane protein [Streptomyces somaliensis]MCP9946537.1 FxsA family protein [Streptomyces somaliensis]MCP9960324.1 FxsA family protein [Streptomyces somaliensis]